jgi:hypothetical protein
MRPTLERLARFPLGAIRRMLSLNWHLRCKCGVWVAGTRVVIGKKNHLGVPLHINGKGSVQIGNKNGFGFSMAPRLGNGSILIQARVAEAEIVIGDENITSNNVSLVYTK